jgi:hypothetical protein
MVDWMINAMIPPLTILLVDVVVASHGGNQIEFVVAFFVRSEKGL